MKENESGRGGLKTRKEQNRERPLNLALANLRNLPEDLWQAVLAVIITPSVSDFLAIGLSLSPQVPPFPERVAA